MNISFCNNIILGLVMSPFLLGVINRIKAVFAGRRGQPLFQAYFDIWKLLKKDAVYSKTTTWIFQTTPIVNLATAISALLVLPVFGDHALLSFQGNLIFLVYCLGLSRFFTIIAALDTGSSFEGMGASREAQFSVLAEPALIIGIATLARIGGSVSFSSIFSNITTTTWMNSGLAIALIIIALFIVLLVENSRIPFDDPNTHLELTMIHEVMILDYSGPDLGLIMYSASLKMWIFGALIMNTFMTVTGLKGISALLSFVIGMFVLAVIVGFVESIIARVKLINVPKLLVGATALSVLAFLLVLRLAL